jgi:rubrerythrin
MRFSEAGNDMYICQVCGRDRDSVVHPPVWQPVRGKQAGNVCPSCVAKLKERGN